MTSRACGVKWTTNCERKGLTANCCLVENMGVLCRCVVMYVGKTNWLNLGGGGGVEMPEYSVRALPMAAA
jgi:hypothetical protein